METYEQKYKYAIKQAKKELEACGSLDCDAARQIFRFFPELAESKDERIRKEIICYLDREITLSNFGGDIATFKGWIDWLKKQGEIDKTSYDIAEKEKYDFVSGQFIECRKSFNEFKEDNSYWLEYVGNDTYIGRSDNILNKKFHITPRQLYRLFTQQHCPKENNANEETNVPIEYGKYIDECLNEASKHFFSEGEDTYSVADLFYAGVRCGQSWLKKQGEQITKSKTDWSEKDETTLACLIGTLTWVTNNNYHCSEDIPKYMCWLENLKQRLNGTKIL